MTAAVPRLDPVPGPRLTLAENEAPPSWQMKVRGAIIVARKSDTGAGEAHIWHDLHEGTVAALAAVQRTGS
jgi:hypothetical protein